MGALYQITFPNGKAYIGVTAGTVRKRFAEHVYNSVTGRQDRGVNRAIRKYGPGNAVVKTLAMGEFAYLISIESNAIKVFGTRAPLGYNWTDGGEGAMGYKHTPDSLAKMSAIHAGKQHHLGFKHSAEARAKMSAQRKGKPKNRTAEQKEKSRQRMLGNTFSKGVKQSRENVRKRALGILKTKSSSGISFHSRAGKWRAFFQWEGQKKWLGYFDSRDAALSARAAAVAEIANG